MKAIAPKDSLVLEELKLADDELQSWCFTSLVFSANPSAGAPFDIAAMVSG